MILSIEYWIWIAICFLDVTGGVLGWLELRKRGKRAADYLSRILLASAFRSASTIIGLSLFGLNVRAKQWFLWVGIASVAYKAYATWGWVLYSRNILNGGGWLGLLLKRKH